MDVHTGAIYWPKSKENIPHPYVILEEIDPDKLKVVTLTTNQKKASMPGVVILEAGEGNLEKQSIVESYNILEISKDELGEFIGSLSEERVNQILNASRFIDQSFLQK